MSTPTRAESNTVGLRMGLKVVNGGVTLHGKRRTSATLRLAELWDCSVRMAEERMARSWKDAADVTVELMSRGEQERLAAMMAPLDAALIAWKVVPAHDDAIRSSTQADTAEDVAETDYHLLPCRETARALVKASAAERFRAEQREAALIAKWEL